MELALADPKALLDQLAPVLESETGRRRVELLRAAGVAHRELQELDQSALMLTTAAQEAQLLGDQRLAALVQVSLAATTIYHGDAIGAVAIIDEAVDHLDGPDRFMALGQRAGILHRSGRLTEALAGFEAALADPFASEPTSALAELHNNRGILLAYLGQFDEAEADFVAARSLLVSLGYDKRGVDATQNLAWLAGRRGDLARALQLFDEALAGYQVMAIPPDAVLPDRCEVLLAAGLLHEALEVAETACIAFDERGDVSDRGEALVMVAQICLRLRRWARAAETAAAASELFRTSGRVGWAEHAEALRLDATIGADATEESTPEDLAELRAGLERGGLDSARSDFDLLHARLLISRGDIDEAATILRPIRVSSLPDHARPAARAIRARIRLARGDLVSARRELARGVDDLDAVRASLGSSELRVSIGFHADDVIRLGQQLAIDAGRPAEVLKWCERGRARSLRYQSVEAVQNDELDSGLDALRQLEQQLAVSAADADGTQELRDAIASEAAKVRNLSRHRSTGARRHLASTMTIRAIRAELGSGSLVQLVDDGAVLRAVTVTDRTSALRDLASTGEVQHAAGVLRASLARIIRGHGDDRLLDAAAELLTADIARLDALLSGMIPSSGGLVVLVPTPSLVAVPWALLPSLADRAFVVAPSVASWLASSAHSRSRSDELLVVAGPRLAFATTEVHAVAGAAVAATLLVGEDATAGAVAAALRTADIAHLVCHGRFVADNPLLSSLEMADGPLYLYDLERQGSLPEVMVLSACHTAVSAARPGEELIGFISTLLGAGCASVIASSVPVPDTDETVAAMVELHRDLAAGKPPSLAVRLMRGRHPIVGAAFNAFGGGN